MSLFNDQESLEWDLQSKAAAQKLSARRRANDSIYPEHAHQNPTNDPRFDVPKGYRRENGRLVIDIPKQGTKPAPIAKSIESQAPSPDFGSMEETAKAMIQFWSEKLKKASSVKDSVDKVIHHDDIDSALSEIDDLINYAAKTPNSISHGFASRLAALRLSLLDK